MTKVDFTEMKKGQLLNLVKKYFQVGNQDEAAQMIVGQYARLNPRFKQFVREELGIDED